MKKRLLFGIVSEALLVAGIVCVALGLRTFLVCLNSFCPASFPIFEEDSFSLGLVLLIASAIGFLLSLRESKGALTTKGGTAN